MIDLGALQIVLSALTGWLDRQEREAVAYLIEQNRLVRRQLGGHRLRLSMTIAAGWPRERTVSAAQPCGTLRRSRCRTPCSGGTAS